MSGSRFPDAASASRCVCVGRNGFEPKSVQAPALLIAPHAAAGLYFILATCYDNLRDRPKALEAYQRYLELSHNQNPDQEWQARHRLIAIEPKK